MGDSGPDICRVALAFDVEDVSYPGLLLLQYNIDQSDVEVDFEP